MNLLSTGSFEPTEYQSFNDKISEIKVNDHQGNRTTVNSPKINVKKLAESPKEQDMDELR